MKNKLIKIIMLGLTLCMTAGMFSACEKFEPIEVVFEKYSCREELKEDNFEPKEFFVTSKNNKRNKYQGYQLPTIQIDDKCSISLGKTTLGEIYEIFMGVTVEEQIRTARADDEGLLDKTPEEIEEEKMLEKQKEENGISGNATETTENSDPIYSFYLQLDSDDDSRTYAPIYLISSNLVKNANVKIYKHGMPYVQLNFSTKYPENYGIHQESDLVVTGIHILSPSRTEYADNDGLNSAAKENVWMNGGFSFTGDKYEYTTLPTVFETWQLKTEDGYGKHGYYYTKVDDDNFYYYAELPSYEPVFLEDKIYINQAIIEYVVNRDSQKITSLSINLEKEDSYNSENYTFSLGN